MPRASPQSELVSAQRGIFVVAAEFAKNGFKIELDDPVDEGHPINHKTAISKWELLKSSIKYKSLAYAMEV